MLAASLAGCTSGQPLLSALTLDALKPTTTVVRSPGSESLALPVPPPPEVVQVLKLVAPAVRGRVTLTKTLRYVHDRAGEPPKTPNSVATFATVTTYTASGSTSMTDDAGAWTFTYVPEALRDSTLKLDSLQGLGILFQSALPVEFEIDWDESTLIGPDDKTRRLLRRGDLTPDGAGAATRSRVAPRGVVDDWVLPAVEGPSEPGAAVRSAHAFFERLPPGVQMSLALTLRGGDAKVVRKFVFETRPLRVEAPLPRPVSKWVGELFVVLPRPPSRAGQAYDALRPREQGTRPPTHEELARAVLKVTVVKYDRLDPVVTLVRDAPGAEYTARPVAGSIEGLAPVADLLSARNQWMGKTVWLAEPNLQTADEGGSGAGALTVKRFTAVEVVDVNLGWSSAAPARFVVKTPDGRLGYRDVHMTGTNVPEALRARDAFEQVFLTEDPRSEFDWPADVWTAIEDGRVVVGMTAEQARMSWGAPRRIERAVSDAGQEERWMFAGRPALALVGGVVTRVDY